MNYSIEIMDENYYGWIQDILLMLSELMLIALLIRVNNVDYEIVTVFVQENFQSDEPDPEIIQGKEILSVPPDKCMGKDCLRGETAELLQNTDKED